jgi:hypothetical protein
MKKLMFSVMKSLFITMENRITNKSLITYNKEAIMVELIAETARFWHFITPFYTIIEVRKSRYSNLITAKARAREKATTG